MKETLLVFNITDSEKLAAMRKALLPLKIRVKRIEKKDYLEQIGYLAGNKEMASRQKEYEGEELSGEMLLMAGFSNSRVDELLTAFRKNKVERIDCKAVLTPTNAVWNVLELYDELRKEHEIMHKDKREE